MLDAAKRQLEPRANEASGNRQESGLQERQGLRDHSGRRRSSLSVTGDRGEIIRTLQANSNVKLVNVTSDMCSLLPRTGEGIHFDACATRRSEDHRGKLKTA